MDCLGNVMLDRAPMRHLKSQKVFANTVRPQTEWKWHRFRFRLIDRQISWSVLLTKSVAQWLREWKCPFRLCRASLHTVTEGTHTLLPIPGETGPSYFPHRCITEICYIGPYGCDGCQKKDYKLNLGHYQAVMFLLGWILCQETCRVSGAGVKTLNGDTAATH